MTLKPTRIGAIGAILRKDLKLYSRDLLFVFLTVLSIVTFVTLYWVLPRDVDETISLGVHGDDVRMAMEALTESEEEGLDLRWYPDTQSLRDAVENRDIEVGVEFSPGFIQDVMSGDRTTVTVFVRPNLPEEITGAMQSMVREIAYVLAGYQLPVTSPRL